MKKKFAFVLLGLLVAVASCSFTNTSFETDDKDKLLLELITFVLEKGHFDPKQVDDDFSVQVYDNFIEGLDPTKRYFLAEDINEFEQYKFQLDDQIMNKDITFFDLVYTRLQKRMANAQEIYKKVLAEEFNYELTESINVDYENQPYVATNADLKERWRKQLKYATLGTYDGKLEREEEKKKEDASYSPLTKKEVEKAARESTQTALEDFFDFVDDLQRKDYYVQYINAIVEGFDPHTFYLAPEDKEKFDMNMSGKFEGIGARLQKKKDQTKIVEVISGGPVWRDQRIEVGDEILKVGQEGEQPVDIVGMRLEDAIKLIKGGKGTIVNLTIKKVDGTTEVIDITRDVVLLEESYAKSATVIKGDNKFGIIDLPKFYIDFKDYGERNAATDVAQEIERLKEEGAEGLILDLRDNGGGSLKTVIDMAGLFIKDGPIVQVRSSGERKDIYDDTDPMIQWDGPLVILVNELSASASEILAAAMQDYKRAIVIGSKQTFGKGTVQNVIGLDNIVRNNEFGELGALKLTTQKFYRINGGSTQLEGVKSDIVVPDRYSYIEIGERDQENPLPWDKISPADFVPWGEQIDFETTLQNSKTRLSQNPQIALIDTHAKWLKSQQDEVIVSLNYGDYKMEEEKTLQKIKEFDSLITYDSKMTFKSPQYEEGLFTEDVTLREKRDRWHKTLAKDVYVEEAINVLQDLKTNRGRKITANKLVGVKG